MFARSRRSRSSLYLPAALAAVVLCCVVFTTGRSGNLQGGVSEYPEGVTQYNRGPSLYRLRGGCDANSGFRSKYADAKGFYGDFGSDARGILDDKKFPKDSKVKLEATSGSNKVVASKTFDEPGEIRFRDSSTAKTSDLISLELERQFGDNLKGFISLDDKSRIRAGGKTTQKMGDADLEMKVSSGGSSVDAEAKYTSDNFKASLGVGGLTDKTLGSFHGSMAVGGINNLDGVSLGAEVKGTQDGVSAHSIGMKYSGPDYSIAGSLQGTDTVSATAYKTLDADTKVAAKGSYNFQTKGHNFMAGVSHSLDDSSTVSGRIDASGTVGVAVHHKVRAGVEVSAGADVNLNDLGAKPKMGVQVHLGSMI